MAGTRMKSQGRLDVISRSRCRHTRFLKISPDFGIGRRIDIWVAADGNPLE
jgi:hypothetical protein